MNKTLRSVMTLVAAILCWPLAAAQDLGEPAVTIHTNAYKEIGASNAFRILLGVKNADYYDIDFGWGANEYEVEPSYIDTEAGELSGTWIPATVSEGGIIKIYGDPANIDILDIEGAYITEIEMSKCVNLEILGLEHNTLQHLDLTPFTKLAAIYLTDNPFTPQTPLIIGAPKPNLGILEIDIIDNIDPYFNFSDYPSLMVIDAYHNRSLKKCDVSGCPELLSLSLEMTDVSELDLSNNPKLYHLNISESRITDIDLKKLPKLQRLLAGHVSGHINTDIKLNKVNLTKNPLLVILDLAGNGMESVNLAMNPELTNLALQGNNLTSLDLSNNTNLYSVNVMHNKMTYATLPLPQTTWGEYFYLQQEIPVAKAVKVGTAIDFSESVLREGTNTTATVWRSILGAEPEPLEASAYTYADGVVTFKDTPLDSVYVRFSNDVFNEYDMFSTVFMVKSEEEFGKPTRTMMVFPNDKEGTMSFVVGMLGATAANPKTFYVQKGEGELLEFTATATQAGTTPNVKIDFNASDIFNIYMPEGESMTSFAIDGVPLSGIDLSAATELQTLDITNCGLKNIGLAFNRCLQSIDLSGNALTLLDLTGVYGDYEKNVLNTVKAENNLINSFVVVSSRPLRNIDLSGNRLVEFQLKDFDNISKLDLSDNLLEGEMNLAYLTQATDIDLSGNKLTSVVYDTFANLQNFDLSDNRLTLETLPYMPGQNGYVYAPQKDLKIYAKAPAVNLSAQNRVINGKGTEFKWYKADGTALTANQVVCENGATTFPDPSIGEVYCTMTNPAFPQFKGDDIFRTTDLLVQAPPTIAVATFTTTEDSDDATVIFRGNKETQLFIDWRGDRTDFVPYEVVDTMYIRYDAQRTFAGADVTVYTYDSPADITVFSMNEIPMSQFDGTALTSVETLALSGAGLEDGKMLLPETDSMTELLLSGNNLTTYPWADRYPNLYMLNMSNNKLKTFDCSPLKNLGMLLMGGNQLTDIKFNNPNLWNVALDYNQFESINLTGLSGIDQLILDGNYLTTINLAPVRKNLRALSIAQNYFTFATLPVPEDYSKLTLYYYGKQAYLQPEVVEGVVDMSDQAMVKDVPTTYYWFLDEIVEDPESGTLSGEELIEGEEYTIEDGVTSFHTTFTGQERVMCVLQNALFPNMYLRTGLMNINEAGVGEILDDLIPGDGLVNVYTIGGTLLKTKVTKEEALRDLKPGLYIVGKRKVLVK